MKKNIEEVVESAVNLQDGMGVGIIAIFILPLIAALYWFLGADDNLVHPTRIAIAMSVSGIVGGLALFLISRIQLRKAEKSLLAEFSERFRINPPDKQDWMRMKVVQVLVDRDLKTLRQKRKELFNEEDNLISTVYPPGKSVEETIAKIKDFHPSIEAIKQDIADLEALVYFFGFSITPPKK